jgi:CDP-paratose 2-epimerase
MKYLITGGAGFVGGNLAIRFATEGHEVLCIDNLSRRGSENNLRRFLDHKNISFMHCDIRNREDLEAISFNPDIVLECSAQTTAVDGYHNPLYDFTNNTLGVVNVLEFCRKKSSGIIFWSSNKAYSGDFCNSIPMTEDDTRFNWDLSRAKEVRGWTKTGFNEEGDLNGGSHTIYGVTKNAADLLIQEWSVAFNIPAVINRFSCLYGPHQFGKVSQGWMVWFALAKKFNLDLYYYGFGGKQVRDCLHIDDLHSLISKQSNSIDSHYGDYYNVGGGIENTTSILEFNNLLNELIKGQHKKIKNSESRKADQKIYISDITKVCKDFNWNPQIGIEKGMETVIKWIDDEKEDFSWMKGS